MRHILIWALAAWFLVPGASPGHGIAWATHTAQDQPQPERRVLPGPATTRKRRVRPERPRSRGIGSAFSQAGKSAGRGGARFGKNIARGRVLRAGKELGKGMGGFGKHTGIGMGRVGKRTGQTVGRATKRAFTP